MLLRWDRGISSPNVTFDSDRVARRSGNAGNAPRALISGSNVGRFSVTVLHLPVGPNWLTIGGVLTEDGQPDREGKFGDLKSFGLRYKPKTSSAEVSLHGVAFAVAPALRTGDDVHIGWDKTGAVSITISGESAWSWNGRLTVPERCSIVFGVSFSNDAAVRLTSSERAISYGEALLDGGFFSDVALVCADGESLDAHRAVLAAASPVFRTMLQSPMREASEHRIEIRASKGVVVEFLRHVYTGRFEAPTDAAAMLHLAHFYGMEDYAAYCGELLVETVTPETASEAARGIGRLRAAPAGGSDDVFTRLWQRLCGRVEQDPALVRSILEALADSPGRSASAGRAPSERRSPAAKRPRQE